MTISRSMIEAKVFVLRVSLRMTEGNEAIFFGLVVPFEIASSHTPPPHAHTPALGLEGSRPY